MSRKPLDFSQLKLAPKELFSEILEYMVIPTFDLALEYGDQGIIVAKRKIQPYKDVWALPGLRMMKPEEINDTLYRIAKNELGLEIDPEKKTFLGQYVGKFSTESNRQDISTGYLIQIDDSQEIRLNTDHFSSFKIVKDTPKPIGAMYKFYLEKYFELKK
ncbi:MAG: hypothetical protein K0S20_521 [Patescibacteria group bacterium]|jgi:ADP-ribose pyrophosphatase YjhB (NUDIX family)|nr:hypothetical protein [Patescibacteria group bacterium]